jgi:hypothetical protein
MADSRPNRSQVCAAISSAGCVLSVECIASDRHNPHGVEHEAEDEAVYGKLEHDAIPRSGSSSRPPNRLGRMV